MLTSSILEVLCDQKARPPCRAAQRAGHPFRLQISRFAVQAGPEGAAAGDIQRRVDLAASTLSHHLKRLVDAGVLTTRNAGTFYYYAADYGALRALTDYLWEDCCKRVVHGSSAGYASGYR